MLRHRIRLAVTATVLLVACGGGEGGGGVDVTEPSVSALRIVAGAGVSDTVLARPGPPLIVELRENGKPKPGVVVRFEGLPVQGADPGVSGTSSTGVLASAIGSSTYGSFVSDTTDVDGRASVVVQLGTRAGATGLQITCPDLGLADTAVFTVLPGNYTQLIVGVRDTVVPRGTSFGIAAYGADRFGNARAQDKVTYAALDTLGTVDSAGRVLAGQGVGRGAVVTRIDATEDTAHFTVVPPVKLTALYEGADGLTRIATLTMDGANLRLLRVVPTQAYPSHSPTDDLIAYQEGINPSEGIKLVAGTAATRILVDQAVLYAAYYPVFGPDGSSIYFSGSSTEGSGYGIWKIGVDGKGLIKLASTDFGYSTPGVSPDGKRIAFSRSTGLFIRSLATGDSVKVGASGWFPNFSPDGQRVAYVDDAGTGITIANVDGTASNHIATVSPAPEARVSWTPDGRWLLTRRSEEPVLVDIASGTLVPLPSLRKYREITIDR
jgi:hypothetical protein